MSLTFKGKRRVPGPLAKLDLDYSYKITRQ